MAFQRFNSTDPANLAALLNRLGDELTAEASSAGSTATWAGVSNKPATYPPAPHTHGWAAIADKPTTYPSAAHSHAVADVTGLGAALSARALITRGLLSSAANLDTMHTAADAGVWALSGSATYAGAPASGLQGTVEIVFGRDQYGVTQRISSEGRLWWRELNDSTAGSGAWSPWAESATVAQVAPLANSTGWREVPIGAGATGRVFLNRTGPLVEYRIRDVYPAATGTLELTMLPTGFRPSNSTAAVRLGNFSTDTGVARNASYFSGSLRMLNTPIGTAFGGGLNWTTTDAWPSVLPGTPA